jgi:hypothetical protein
MTNRFTAVAAGSAGLMATVAAFALAIALDQRPAPRDARNLRPARLHGHAHASQIAEDAAQPSVFTIPTVTVVGEVHPRRGAAEMQRIDLRDTHMLLVPAPRSARAVADALHP